MSVLRELRRLQAQCPAIVASSEPIDDQKAKENYVGYKGFVRYRCWQDPTGALREVLKEYLPPDESTSSEG